MLNKRKRLRSLEVDEVLAKGRSVRSIHLQVKHLASKEALRTAAVVPKSLVKRATGRNNVRRALYRAIAQTQTGAHGHAVCFVRALPTSPLTPTFAEELTQLFSKLT